jgi:hypothetical protein
MGSHHNLQTPEKVSKAAIFRSKKYSYNPHIEINKNFDANMIREEVKMVSQSKDEHDWKVLYSSRQKETNSSAIFL